MNSTSADTVQLGDRDFAVLVVAVLSALGSALLSVWRATKASKVSCCGHRCFSYEIEHEPTPGAMAEAASDGEVKRMVSVMEAAARMMRHRRSESEGSDRREPTGRESDDSTGE